jgi:hypothetical protein
VVWGGAGRRRTMLREAPCSCVGLSCQRGDLFRRIEFRRILSLTRVRDGLPQSTGQRLQRPLIAFDAWLLLALGR